MRAVRVNSFGGPEVLRLEEVPDPRPPGAGEVLVRLHAAGVNPVDTYLRAGRYAMLPPLPYTPGGDGAGVVEAVGSSAAPGSASSSQAGAATGSGAPRPGEPVYTSGAITGTYAELALCPAAHVHRLPSAVSFVEGAAVGVPYATAYRALFQRGRAQQGELVLVRGASGGVGLAAVQLAVAANLTVHGTAGSPAGRDLVTTQGAALVVDHGAPDHDEQLRAASGGRGYDLIVEMAAHAGLGADLALLASRGRVIVVGSRGPVEIVPRELMSREADVRGLLLTTAPAGELAAAHDALFDGLASGRLRPVVARELPLAEAPRAHREIMAGPATGKIVLVP